MDWYPHIHHCFITSVYDYATFKYIYTVQLFVDMYDISLLCHHNVQKCYKGVWSCDQVMWPSCDPVRWHPLWLHLQLVNDMAELLKCAVQVKVCDYVIKVVSIILFQLPCFLDYVFEFVILKNTMHKVTWNATLNTIQQSQSLLSSQHDLFSNVGNNPVIITATCNCNLHQEWNNGLCVCTHRDFDDSLPLSQLPEFVNVGWGNEDDVRLQVWCLQDSQGLQGRVHATGLSWLSKK